MCTEWRIIMTKFKQSKSRKTFLAFALSAAMIISLPAAFATADDNLSNTSQDTTNTNGTTEEIPTTSNENVTPTTPGYIRTGP